MMGDVYMSLLQEEKQDKINQKCANCHKGTLRCIGTLLFLEPEERIELYREMKKESGLSNAAIAEQAGLSEMSVSRFFAGHTKDTKVSTLFDILRVIMGKDLDRCQKHTEELAPSAQANAEEVQKKVQEQKDADRAIIDYLKKDIERLDAQLAVKDHLLNERAEFLRLKDKYIWILALLLGISVVTLIAMLIVDAMDPNLGFFWREMMATIG